MYGSESQTQGAMPDQPEREIAISKAEELASLGRVADSLDKPMSSTETAMIELEQEIMELDEAFSVLQRRLQPVMNEESQKMAEAATDDRNVRMPVSELARSINEKASRVRFIRYRVTATIRSVDL